MKGDDDKTVILSSKPAQGVRDEKVKLPSSQEIVPVHQKPGAETAASSGPSGGGANFGVAVLSVLAIMLVGVSAALLTVYLATSGQEAADVTQDEVFTDAELEAQLSPVQDEASEAADQALIESVVGPGVIELSGDPVVVRQVQGKARQLVKLNSATALAASRELGAKGDVYRLTDMLDAPATALNRGVLGSQEDFAAYQNAAFRADAVDADDSEEGTSVLQIASATVGPARREFARELTGKTTVAQALEAFGLDSEGAAAAGRAFEALYGVKVLDKTDAIAVVSSRSEEAPDRYVPVQVSIYREDELLATVAMNDLGFYTKGEDPWYQKDIFAAELLPEDNIEGKPQRLLDAIYSVALRNGLPSAVAGETIMMMSRVHDLEQQVAPGDSIAILYSPAARDARTGFGRVLYVRVARSAGNIECYVYQPVVGGPFECVTPDGGSSLQEAGLVMPVSGSIVAKFGPQGGAEGGDNMNFGVDIAAPRGADVVAAAPGRVTSAGSESKFGNVIRIAHDDGSETTYAYMARFATGLAAGDRVNGGQVIGYVGTPPSSREPRLHFELRRNGEPVDPVGEVQQSIGTGSPVDAFVGRIIYIESGNKCHARNPLSTAVGLGQFIESTWMTTVRIHRPDLLKGRTRAQVLDLRLNCELSKAMTTAFTRDNAAVIRSRGHAVTPGNLYLAHFLGVGGSIKALSANRSSQVADVFGAHMVRANPFLRGKNIDHLINWAAKKMSGKTPKRPITTPGKAKPAEEAIASNKAQKTKAAAKDASATKDAKDNDKAATPQADVASATSPPSGELTRYASDPRFAALKRSVDVLMR